MGPADLGIPSEIDQNAPDEDQRFSFIGGSEAFELLNRSQYGRGCARALAYRKLQTPEDVQSDHNKERAMAFRKVLARGNRLEKYIADFYIEVTGRQVIKRTRLVRNRDHFGAGCHHDRIILSDGERPVGDLEIKSHAEGPFLHILRDGLPPAHNLQLQWAMFCSDHTWASFAMLGVFGDMPLKYFDRERDEELMEIFARETDRFWNLLAHGQLPPQLEDPRDVRCKACHYRLTCRGEALDPQEYQRLINEREGRKTLIPISNDELDEALCDRALILSEIRALDSNDHDDPGTLQIVDQRIKDLLGDEQAALVNRHWKVYQSDTKWSGVDIARLRVEQPEIYEKYLVKGRLTGSRQLRVYAMHDGK